MRTPQNREWLEAVKKGKGKARPNKQEEEESEEITLFPESKPFWELFVALNHQRQMGANGPQAFTITDIYNAALMMRFEAHDMDVVLELISALDQINLDHEYKVIQKRREEEQRRQQQGRRGVR